MNHGMRLSLATDIISIMASKYANVRVYQWFHHHIKQLTRFIFRHIFSKMLLTSFQERSWWRHQIETFSALLAFCVGNSSVNSPHIDHGRGALIFSLIWAWAIGSVNNRAAGDLRRHRAYYDVTVMKHHCLQVALDQKLCDHQCLE